MFYIRVLSKVLYLYIQVLYIYIDCYILHLELYLQIWIHNGIEPLNVCKHVNFFLALR